MPRRLRASASRPLRAGRVRSSPRAHAGCITIDLPFGGPGELEETVVAGESRPEAPAPRPRRRAERARTRRAPSGSAGRESAVARVREQLERARRGRRGEGGCCSASRARAARVTASDILYREVLRFKEETKRPVVAQLHGGVRLGRLLRRDGRRPHPRAPDHRHRLDRRDLLRTLARRPDGEATASRTRRSRAARSRTRARPCAA